ncbi:hypothetical protein AT984_02510 [Paucibacter sp. KCTC 42545]|nr:hypothetical protein AT984_02510 [Paucibacter sp. KCTC 42545]
MRLILTGLLLTACGYAAAAISPGKGYTGNDAAAKAKYDGNGEMAFVVYDSEAKVSYAKDLGLDLNAFFVSAQQENFTQLFFPIADPQWVDFLQKADISRLKWALFGVDVLGTNKPGDRRFFTTATQGTEGTIATMTNQSFGALIVANAGPSGFLDLVNTTGTHGVSGTTLDYSSNGSSFNSAEIDAKSYFGSDSPVFNENGLGRMPFTMGNDVGKSSWFYYLTRSSLTNNLANVLVDEFDNVGNDGYWGFTKVADNANSPYKGQYLLSYTLEASTPKAATALGQARINLTDFSAGFMARAYLPESTEFAGYRPSSLVMPSVTVSAVPEPASWGLMALGLLALGGRAARVRQAKRVTS